MSTEDHIWALVAKRLANEATEEELQELDKLLKQYADIDKRVKIMADWWDEGNEEETAQRGVLLFERIKGKINAKENERTILVPGQVRDSGKE
jgi:putative ABC transport system permease protein